MSINKYILFFIILFLSFTATTNFAQSVTDNEIKAQLSMIAELESLRATNDVLYKQKQGLEETLKINEQIIKLKDTQIATLLEVINEYNKLKLMYTDQIKFQQAIIDNSTKIIESQQKLQNKNKTFDNIKAVLFAILGVVVGSKL